MHVQFANAIGEPTFCDACILWDASSPLNLGKALSTAGIHVLEHRL